MKKSTNNLSLQNLLKPATKPRQRGVQLRVEQLEEHLALAVTSYMAGDALIIDGADDPLKGDSVQVIVRQNGVSVDDFRTRPVQSKVYPVSKVRTIIFHGKAGDDVFQNQTNIPAYIDGGAGNDIIFTGYGDDTVAGGDGHDTICGGAGRDIIDGGVGLDWLYGGKGDDIIFGADGADVILGEDGDDLLFGGLAYRRGDRIEGGRGNDTIVGGLNEPEVFQPLRYPGDALRGDPVPPSGRVFVYQDVFYIRHAADVIEDQSRFDQIKGTALGGEEPEDEFRRTGRIGGVIPRADIAGIAPSDGMDAPLLLTRWDDCLQDPLAEARRLDQEHHFIREPSDWLNWGGQNEKWITDPNWDSFFILPNGELYRWDGTMNQASGTLLARLDPSFYEDTSRLAEAAPERLIIDVGNWTNWGGQNEEWVVGIDCQWYYITPDGGFYRWDGTDRVASGQLIQQLDSSYYSDLTKLTDPNFNLAVPALGSYQLFNNQVRTWTYGTVPQVIKKQQTAMRLSNSLVMAETISVREHNAMAALFQTYERPAPALLTF